MEFELCKSILKMWGYSKSRLYEQILKVGTPTFRKFFLIFLRPCSPYLKMRSLSMNLILGTVKNTLLFD
ncbi:hypothetical protein BUQ74_02225 [Leptospira weilii serovar Heyan]|nr:hypothetical protein BUQ74_02225 [Leptospira weilii serovar Heyan]